GVPYTDEQIATPKADLEAQKNPDGDTAGLMKRYRKAVVANFTGNKSVTEMDALVAYLQVLGTMVDFTKYQSKQLQQ
ncbi:cbb3-type cytochrome c oxidase subunit II, partial [Azospirillum sp. B506]|uniref:cbb3-type cytochrome c oxidase subunit II n=1 Tax=Azospirillum sp. B506 TaxID=137721 RepID=UPI0019026969